jgi:DNA-binding protein YbaB
MSTPLPNPSTLLSGLFTLDRTLAEFDSARANAKYSASSSDGKVTVVVNGLLRVDSISIVETELALGATALAAKVKTAANAAITAADTAGAAALKTLASTLSLPGLPSFGSVIPDYPDFNITANSITAQILANNPCMTGATFECRVGPVVAVIDAHRHVVTLTFDSPLPVSASYLAMRARHAINCAEDDATERPEINPIPPIIESLGLQDLVIYAKGELKLNDRVRVKSVNCQNWGAIGNAGTVQTNIGVDAEVGKVLSRAKVIVRDKGKVHGFLRTSDVFENHEDTEIEGPIDEHATVVLPDLLLNVPFPTVTVGTIELEPSQQQTAAPGYYNKLHAKANAQVFLSAGTYYFNEFLLEPGAKIWLNQTSGPAVIWVKTSFTHRGSVQVSGGAFPRLFIGYLGTSTAVVESKFYGTLSAPNAKISVSTIQSHEGAFHGKNVEVQPDTHICHHPFELRYDELPGTVPPGGLPPPAVDLGFETANGWSSPQALLTSVQNPVTQGARSLRITNVAGTTDVVSANFSAALAPQGCTRLIVDLWVPGNQPNPTFFGNLQVLISVPSAGVNAVNLGTLGLTGKPTNKFSQFEFALPAAVRTALDGNASDVSLKLVLSINANSGPWYIDNIRFLLPSAPLSSLDPILSFEDGTKWSSTQTTLTTSTQFKTHLQKSLRVTTAPGWTQITSVPFPTDPLSAPLGRFRVDLRKPLPQPNASWHGQFQLQIDVPSAGISNATTSTVALTPLAGNTFVTIELALPTTVAPVVNGDYGDMTLKLILNVTANSGPWHLDNIRFL